MSVEAQDLNKHGGDRDAGGKTMPFWWLLLVIIAAQVFFVIMGLFFQLIFGQPEDSMLVVPSGLIVACAVFHAETRTFRQLGRVMAIGVGLGTLAMLCSLPAAVLSQGVAIPAQAFTLRVFSMGLITGVGVWDMLAAYRFFGVPLQRLKNSAEQLDLLTTWQ